MTVLHGDAGQDDSIAVVGMSCRFPGGIDSPQSFWRVLESGGEAIGTVPPGRWAGYLVPGETPATGGFRDDIDAFDADFFGLSPREAALMDPQQRMLLELAWEGLEHAGVVPSSLAGSDTGVFVGVNTDDYGRRLLEDLPRIEAWTGIGSSLCAVANRVSYTFDLCGPSMAVDTACSASLTAIHLACQSLRTGETPLAIAGGVMLMAAPGLTTVMDAVGALAPNGRSRSFSAFADGYGRGEGAGVVVLKRFADARRDGDQVLAVLRGSAVRQDGRTDGIMAPNATAQQKLLRSACEAAGVMPRDVDYVEAHGTGTPVGDSVELAALEEVFGAGRRRPCLIGSVKTNIGHLEAASGVAGLIKTVLALRHEVIPPSAHGEAPNTSIDWDTAGLRIPPLPTAWPRGERTRMAGVSGFGYGGTIAHLIVAEAPSEPDPVRTGAGVLRVFPLFGGSAAAVRSSARRLADWLGEESGSRTPLADVAHTLAHRREPLGWRAAVTASDRAELISGLDAVNPVPVIGGGDAVWVFSGHGSQWPGMGLELARTEPEFGAALDRLAPVLHEECARTPGELLSLRDPDTPAVQVLLFVLQVALAATWARYGLRPAAVIGHSVGEVAAAVVAGALTEEQGARLVCRRSRLLRSVAGAGAMASVGLSFEEVAERVGGVSGVVPAVSVAPCSTVVAGPAGQVADLTLSWRHENVLVQRVNSDVAFHSPQMEPLLPELRLTLRELSPKSPEIPLYSTALADPRDRAPRDGSYWAANLGSMVRFRQAIEAAVEDGHRNFLEISPHPLVVHSISDTASAAGVEDVEVTYTLRRDRPERRTLLDNLGHLHSTGVPLDWSAVQPDGTLAEVPTMAWQHQRYWIDPPEQRPGRPHDPRRHDLLGAAISVPGPSPIRMWQTRLTRSTRPYPGRHPVLGVEIVPAAVLLNTFRNAAGSAAVTDVVLRTPVPVEANRELRVSLQEGNLALTTRIPDTEHWITHSTAVAAADSGPGSRTVPVPHLGEYLDPDQVSRSLADTGVSAMGFDWHIEQLSAGPGELLARVRTAPPGEPKCATAVAGLDAALSIGATVSSDAVTLRMPAHIDRIVLPEELPEEVFVHVRRGEPADLEVLDLDGIVLAEIKGVRYRSLSDVSDTPAEPRRLVHDTQWVPAPERGAEHPVDQVLVVGGGADHIGRSLAVPCRHLDTPDELGAISDEITASTAVLVTATQEGRVGVAAFHVSWSLLRTLRFLADLPIEARPRLWCLTRGVAESGSDLALVHSPLWGLGRVLGTEHPDLWGGIVDLGTEEDDGALLGILRTGRQEDPIVVRDGSARVPRLVPLHAPAAPAPLACRPDGTYLVTGGLGALGREVARWLTDRGARRLVLVGRQGLPPRELWDEVTGVEQLARIECVRDLEASGVTVRVLALDITDRVQAPKLLSTAELGLPPIRGVVHAAGVLDSRMAVDTDIRSLIRVMRPKIAGALVLHEMFPPGSIDFFTLFSSVGPMLGLPGQASYAAANAFLDSLAVHRRAGGASDTTSISWTSWRGLGMSTTSDSIDAELRARGTADITPVEALGSWDYTRYGSGHAAVLRVIPGVPGTVRPALLTELDPTGIEPPAGTEHWNPERLRAEVISVVAAELRLAVEELDPRRPLPEMGADSVLVQTIRRALERRFAASLPTNLLWSRPSTSGLAEHMTELLCPETRGEVPSTE